LALDKPPRPSHCFADWLANRPTYNKIKKNDIKIAQSKFNLRSEIKKHANNSY